MSAKVAEITEREKVRHRSFREFMKLTKFADSDTKAMESAACLKLPLTEDNYLAHSRHVALDYYKALMASVR